MNYWPYLVRPEFEALPKKIESPFDCLKVKDEENIFSPSNNKIMLEFTKGKDANEE